MSEDIRSRLLEVSKAGTCSKKQVGCVIIGEYGDVIIEAANRRPGAQSCAEGNCYRCVATDEFEHGRDHDLCSCLHAEQNAICKAAAKGIRIADSMLYSTYQPCLTCLKLIVGSGIAGIRYTEPWMIPTVAEVPDLSKDYASLVDQLPEGCEAI